MTNQEINHEIATQVNGWVHDEGIFYHDDNGSPCYLADYCNSISHALDLAKAASIGIAPNETGWTAYSVVNPEINSSDEVAAKAICLCLLQTLEPPSL
jgi:hypothetical protein